MITLVLVLRHSIEKRSKRKQGLIYEALGRIYYNLKNFQKALDYHDQSLQIAKEVGDWASEVIAYKDLGEVHCSLGEPKKAIEYHNFVLKVVKNLGLSRGMRRDMFVAALAKTISVLEIMKQPLITMKLV